jgi:hypothetical protein
VAALAAAVPLAGMGPGPVRAATPAGLASLDARCARGYGVACRDLGRARLAGEAEPDDRLAAALLMKGCEIGDPGACGDLGVLHALGRGVPQSDDRAAALSRRACEQGSALACANHGVLSAEGAAAAEGGLAPSEDGGRILRGFRLACDAGAPEGCVNLGTALDHGIAVRRDPAAAARAYRRGCDAGAGLACQRLAMLAAERPAAAPGADPAALLARACRAGVPAACEAAGLEPPPPSPRFPAPLLGEEPASFVLGLPGTGGFHVGDLAPAPLRGPGAGGARPSPAVLAQVPPALRARVFADPTPREGAPGDAAVELLAGFRRYQLGACLAAPRAAPGAADGWVSFRVNADGGAHDVRAATDPADPDLEACLVEIAQSWEFPVAGPGGAGPWVLRHAFEPAPGGGTPALAGPGYLRPAPRDPGCLEKRLRLPTGYEDAAGAAMVKLAVDGSGSPVLVHALTPVPDPVLVAVREAAARCEWVPGADESGRKVALWLTVPVRLDRR